MSHLIKMTFLASFLFLCSCTNYSEWEEPLPEGQIVPETSLIEDPIERFTKNGLMTGNREYSFDTIVCATGFAAMTGSFDKISITGRDGLTLSKKWQAGPRAYLVAAQVHHIARK